MPETPEAVQELLDELGEMFGDEVNIGLGTDPKFFHPKISSGSHILDMMLDGGYRLGRYYYLYGPEGAGKTYLTYLGMASAQRWADEQGNGKIHAFIDAEESWDPEWAAVCGVDPNRTYVSRPEKGDTALDLMEVLLRSKQFQGIGCDSVASLLPARELEKKLDERTMGELASLMSRGLRKVTPQLDDCAVFFINQVREKLGVMFGSPMTTPGGKALGFYSSLTLQITRGGLVKEDRPFFEVGKDEWTEAERVVGHEIRIKSIKDKTGSMMQQTCSLWFKYDTNPKGIEEWDELWNIALMEGILKRDKQTYYLANEDGENDKYAVHRQKARDKFFDDNELHERIKKTLNDRYQSRKYLDYNENK